MLTTGCNALDRFEEGGATVFVYATHHATPENGGFPGRGDDNMPRIFDNDLGWTVTLLEAYVTISAVTLVACSGTEYDLDMFWGPCPEDIKDQDLATLTVAGRRVGDGDYCGLRVTYSAYQTPVIAEDVVDTRHETPTNEAVDGTTVYMRGGARVGDGPVTQFEISTGATVVVDLDISEIEGGGSPFNVAHREDFPKELLVSKTYDRFFDGIDFDSFDRAATEAMLPQILEHQTRVSEGTLVSMDDPASETGDSGGI
ncbi:MAG: hypothetical protein KDK70_18675 [Myxococcales bacterium]|nr:hypothetical protein [Myxococcales bacterium]